MQSCQFAKIVSEKGQPSLPFSDIIRTQSFVVFLDSDLVSSLVKRSAHILGCPGAASRDDRIFVVKVYRKIETIHHEHSIAPTDCSWVSEDDLHKDLLRILAGSCKILQRSSRSFQRSSTEGPCKNPQGPCKQGQQSLLCS